MPGHRNQIQNGCVAPLRSPAPRDYPGSGPGGPL